MTTQESDKNLASSQTDEEIMEQFCSTKSPEFLEQLVHRYEQDLYHYLKRYLGDAQLAEDVFQATFLQIFLKSDQFDVTRRFRPWLYMVATNQAIDAQRRNKRHKHASLEKNMAFKEELDGISLLEILPGNTPAPEDALEQMEQNARIQEGIDRLPDSLRQVVILIYFEGIKYREVAEIMQIPVGTVKSRLHSAIKRLGLWIRGFEDF